MNIVFKLIGSSVLFVGAIYCFGLGIYVFIQNAKKQNEYFKASILKKIKMDIDSLIRNEAIAVIINWSPVCFFVSGLFLLCEWIKRIYGEKYVDELEMIVVVVMVASLGLAFGIGGLLQSFVGKESVELEGLVVRIAKSPNLSSKAYRVLVEYKLNGMKYIHYGKYNYSKNSCPVVGTQYDLIYSPKYDKITSKDEIKQNRKYSFYGFGGFIVFALLVGTKFLY